MPATPVVVSFAQHQRKAAAKKQDAQPKTTQWDKDYAMLGEVPAYPLHQVLQAMSVAYQTGDIKMGDKLLAACRAENWDPEITLGKEIGNYFHEADFMIAIRGVEEVKNAD